MEETITYSASNYDMRLNKKTMRSIKAQASHYKRMYESPNIEVDKIIAELKEDAKNMPKNMTKDEEIAWILKEANGEDNFDKLNQIIEDNGIG